MRRPAPVWSPPLARLDDAGRYLRTHELLYTAGPLRRPGTPKVVVDLPIDLYSALRLSQARRIVYSKTLGGPAWAFPLGKRSGCSP